MSLLSALAASIAASLHILASSAPLKPGVIIAIFLAKSYIENLLLNFTFVK
jgi:hypothetical protein